MSGVKVILLASLLLAIALIFSCGEYPEIPYENRIVGENDPAYSSSGEPDPADPSSQSVTPSSSSILEDGPAYSSSGEPDPVGPSSQSVTPSSSSAATANAPQLIWDLKTHGGNVATGGRWFSGDDINDGGESTTDFYCPDEPCQWSSDGSINMSFVPYQIGNNSYLGFADAHFFWKADSTPMPQVWENRIGLCVEYALTTSPASVSSNIQIEVGKAFEYDNYLISMPTTYGVVTKKLFKFSEFKRDGWKNEIESTLDGAKQISRGIQFQTTLRSSTSAARGSSKITLKSISMVSDASQCAETVITNPIIWDLSMGGAVETGGGWFDFNDESSGGGSTTDFICAYPDCPWRDEKQGEINFNFNDQSAPYHAFASVGFSWVDDKPQPDVWGSHTGLCVEYALVKDSPRVIFDIRINSEDAFNYNAFKVELPVSTNITKKFFNFNQFQQEVWGPSDVGTLAEAKQRSIGINFQGNVQDERPVSDIKAALTLKSIRWDSCN